MLKAFIDDEIINAFFNYLFLIMECIDNIKKYYSIFIFLFVKIFGFIKLIDIHIVQ